LNTYLKIFLIIFAVLYLLSPLDIIPDLLLPFVGWIDDGVVIGVIYYLIRYGKLPNFLFKKQGLFKQSNNQKTSDFTSDQNGRQAGGPANEKNRSSKTIQTPYEILGIDSTASKKEIQSAYREAIKKYHPDKLSYLGEEFSILANKKFKEIQNAYDTLMKNKNQ
jgi:hypothetical protein